MAREGGRRYVDVEYREAPVREEYSVPLFCLCDPYRWERLVSQVLRSFGFRYRSQIYARIRSALCIHAPAEAADASRHGFRRLDVAVDVVQRVVVDGLPPPQVVVLADPVPPASPRPLGGDISAPLSLLQCYGMNVKEVKEIDPQETCPICLEEYLGESTTKEVIETVPCSHLFHSDCLLTWLNNANTCPLCRSPLICS